MVLLLWLVLGAVALMGKGKRQAGLGILILGGAVLSIGALVTYAIRAM